MSVLHLRLISADLLGQYVSYCTCSFFCTSTLMLCLAMTTARSTDPGVSPDCTRQHSTPPTKFTFVQSLTISLSQCQLLFKFCPFVSSTLFFIDSLKNTHAHISKNFMRALEVEQRRMMGPRSPQIACLCWLHPQGHLAHFSLCCGEVREACRSEDLTNKLPSVVVAGAGQTAAEDQRGSMSQGLFLFQWKHLTHFVPHQRWSHNFVLGADERRLMIYL